MNFRKIILVLASVTFVILTQAREMSVVSPVPPGGTWYMYTQKMAELIGKWTNVPTIVETKLGGGGVPAAQYLATKTDPRYPSFMIDGIRSDAAYDQLKDVVPVLDLGAFARFIVVRGDNPAENFKTLVEQNKKPTISIGGSFVDPNYPYVKSLIDHMKGRSEMQWVPFKGGGETNQAVIGGHLDANLNGAVAVKGLIESGQLKPLAVLGPYRSLVFPNIPTMKELGYRFPGDGYHARTGLWASPNIDPAIIDLIRKNWVAWIQTSEGQEFLKTLDHRMTPKEAVDPVSTIKSLNSK